jgi:biotin synthase-like enzyme
MQGKMERNRNRAHAERLESRPRESAATYPVGETCLRTGWTREEIGALFELPFTELVYRATEVHRTRFDPAEVHLSTLLSIKTGGCAEDYGYCSQSVTADAGVRRPS